MKKYSAVITILILSSVSISFAGAVKQWDKVIGGSGGDAIASMDATSDGGYIIVADSDSGISGDKSEASYGYTDYWVVKIDGEGNKQWDKTYGGDK